MQLGKAETPTQQNVSKKVQLVLWDTAFQDALMARITQQEPPDAVLWQELIDDVCRSYFPDADEYKLIFNK